MPRKNTYHESEYAADLAKALGEKYPAMYWQELMNEVSCALQSDKWSGPAPVQKGPAGVV